MEWLQPLAGSVDDFSLSSDAYHGSDTGLNLPEIARRAAQQLGIPVDFISIDESAVLYRGRAAKLLAPRVEAKHWEQFTECPWEDLRHPGRVHVDPFGNLHVCQGISIGNILKQPLAEIMASYDEDEHSIVGPLLAGGPAENRPKRTAKLSTLPGTNGRRSGHLSPPKIVRSAEGTRPRECCDERVHSPVTNRARELREGPTLRRRRTPGFDRGESRDVHRDR